MRMLSACELEVEIDAEAGLVRPIDRLSLALRQGETVALVGESGCGKSMTALALMRLLPDSGHVVGGHVALGREDVLALSERDMRAVRGGRIGMIFQEPGTSLNPVMRIGEQIVEAIEAHTELRQTRSPLPPEERPRSRTGHHQKWHPSGQPATTGPTR